MTTHYRQLALAAARYLAVAVAAVILFAIYGEK